MIFTEAQLRRMSNNQLKSILRLARIPKHSNKNKNELVNIVMSADEKDGLKYLEEEKVIIEIRNVLGLTNNPKAKRTKGVRKSFKDDEKTAKQLADEVIVLMKRLKEKKTPKLKRQFKTRVSNMMRDFDEEIKNITSSNTSISRVG